MAKRVLMVLTSHDMMGISGKKTGNWFDEVATPYYKFKEAGFDVRLASPKGGPLWMGCRSPPVPTISAGPGSWRHPYFSTGSPIRWGYRYAGAIVAA